MRQWPGGKGQSAPSQRPFAASCMEPKKTVQNRRGVRYTLPVRNAKTEILDNPEIREGTMGTPADIMVLFVGPHSFSPAANTPRETRSGGA
jgi:hypothetical protein